MVDRAGRRQRELRARAAEGDERDAVPALVGVAEQREAVPLTKAMRLRAPIEPDASTHRTSSDALPALALGGAKMMGLHRLRAARRASVGRIATSSSP